MYCQSQDAGGTQSPRAREIHEKASRLMNRTSQIPVWRAKTGVYPKQSYRPSNVPCNRYSTTHDQRVIESHAVSSAGAISVRHVVQQDGSIAAQRCVGASKRVRDEHELQIFEASWQRLRVGHLVRAGRCAGVVQELLRAHLARAVDRRVAALVARDRDLASRRHGDRVLRAHHGGAAMVGALHVEGAGAAAAGVEDRQGRLPVAALGDRAAAGDTGGSVSCSAGRVPRLARESAGREGAHMRWWRIHGTGPLPTSSGNVAPR